LNTFNKPTTSTSKTLSISTFSAIYKYVSELISKTLLISTPSTIYKQVSEPLNVFLLKIVLCLEKVNIAKIMNINNEFILETLEKIGKAFGVAV